MKRLNLVVCFFPDDLWHLVKMPNVVLKVLILHRVCSLMYYIHQDIRKKQSWDFPGCPGAKTPFQCWGDKIPHSVQFSRSVVSDSLRPHGLQHARPPCPSATPRVPSISCPSHWWCHPTISSSVTPFPSCLQSLPASASFPMSQLFASGGPSIGVSASASDPTCHPAKNIENIKQKQCCNIQNSLKKKKKKKRWQAPF